MMDEVDSTLGGGKMDIHYGKEGKVCKDTIGTCVDRFGNMLDKKVPTKSTPSVVEGMSEAQYYHSFMRG